MAEKSRDKSYILENAEKGAFCTHWGEKWGVSVYPAYGIDKVHFSFIEKGAEGKGKSFDIYMDTVRDGLGCFDSWAEDILDGTMFRVLKAEKDAGEKYPKYYKYNTGAKAEKSVGIMCSSKSGMYVLNAGPGVDNIHANVVLGRNDLIRLARRFRDTYASRMEELNSLMLKVMRDAEEKFNKKQPTADEAGKQQPAEEVKATAEAPAETAAPAKEAEPTKEAPAKVTSTVIEFKTTSPMTSMKNGKDMCVQAVMKDGTAKNIIFRQKVISGIEPALWSKFLKRTEKAGCKFKGSFAETPKGNLEFLGFPA